MIIPGPQPDRLDVRVVLPEPDTFVVIQRPDGRFEALSWPLNTLVDEWTDDAEPTFGSCPRPGIWRVRLDNGEADYAIGDFDPRYRAWPARRIRLVTQ